MKRLFILILAMTLAAGAFAQNPTSQAAMTVVNATTVQGVGQGYYPTHVTGLTMKVGAGTAYCGKIDYYGGGNFTMTPSTTNYVYLDLTYYCFPKVNTTGFGTNIPIAIVVTSASAITTLTDVRTMFNAGQMGTAGTGAFAVVNGLYHYKDVVSYTHNNAGPTGTLEIALPSGIAPGLDTSINMTINGFSWPWGAWTLQVAGFPGFIQCGPGVPNAWCGASVAITGAFPYGYVRLGWDRSLSQFVVLLGTTTTSWDNLTVEVTDFTPNPGARSGSGLGTGWSTTILTSEGNISNVNKVYNVAPYTSVGPVPAEGNLSTGNGVESSVNFEVEGSSLDIPLLSGGANAVYHYRDVVSSYGWASPSELEIALPSAGVVGGQTGEINMTLIGYDYGSNSAWQVMVGGLAGTHTWSRYSAVVSGNPPFGSLRLAYDTSLSRYVVLLGPTSTIWAFPWMEVADFVVGYQAESNWGTGWSITPITNETSLTNIVTPAATWPTGQLVAKSYCGSLAGSAGCSVVKVNGDGTHYLPYW